MNRSRNNNSAGRRLGLEPDGDVHAIAVYVVVLDDQVTQMHANAKHHSGVRGLVAVGFRHGLLELNGSAKRAHGTGELHQRAVAGQFDQSPTMAGERRFEAFGHVALNRVSVPFSSRPIRRE